MEISRALGACAVCLALTAPPAAAQPLSIAESLAGAEPEAPPAAGEPPPAAEPAEPFVIPADSLEPFNRAMFALNTFLVTAAIDPAARFIGDHSTAFVRRTVGNVYENLREPEFIFTNLMAGYLQDAVVSAKRLLLNTTVGIGGAFDVATASGLKRRPTEFSEAICKYGIPPGPYLVLPVVGSTNVFSAGPLAAVMATEWFVVGILTLVVADVQNLIDDIMDLSVSAASLAHARSLPPGDSPDPYAEQQQAFWQYVSAGCTATPDETAAAAAKAGKWPSRRP